MHAFIMTADKALKKLKEGNAKYLNAETSRGKYFPYAPKIYA